ncbi:MAG: helix-turn-helix transcriptional regulator [Bacteroidota bacterium]|nr:helix-turn-helix transcriptional regulator [Bacteroidota bacterium]MDP3914608.1 helix-turn-helix transcriptional regulator [Bacteroidota bacterium]
MDKFGDIVRSKREAKGLLLRQLAAMIDIDTAILSKIERGERKARREQVVRIAEALEFNANELMIQYLSENIAYEILQEDSAKDILKVAECKINYLRNLK